MSLRFQRLLIILFSIIMVLTALLLILFNARENISYFYTPSEIDSSDIKMNKKTFEEQMALYNERMEECGGDYLEYAKKYNRHTLKITLLNEQVGEALWGDTETTFYNEDNAIVLIGNPSITKSFFNKVI